MEGSQPAHIAMFCPQGMGHLIPLTEFARKLVQLRPRKFSITFIIPDDGSSMKAQKQLLQSLLPSINSIYLPPVSFDDLSEDATIETRLVLSVVRSLPSLSRLLTDLMNESGGLSAFVVDLFCTLSLQMVKDLGIPSYIFFPSPAMGLRLGFEFPRLDESVTGDYRDLAEPVRLPGCVPIPGPCLPELFFDRESDGYKGTLALSKMFPLADGIFVNTFLDLEAGCIKAFNEECGSSNKPSIYPVGPLIRPGSTNESTERPECLKWLDKQPAGSVLYVSFGSGGTLSSEQQKELALGLEMSGQRFLMVAKNPNDKARNAAFFHVIEQDKIESHLVNGFIEGPKGKGFVVAQWAPQIEVLSHSAVGGFLTHCGWNSILESVVNGVPLIAWPLYAEQKMNELILTEGLKIALWVRENENGLVDCEQIAKLARALIEGEEGKEVRVRMRNLKDAAAKALSPNGSSTMFLAEVAEKWMFTTFG